MDVSKAAPRNVILVLAGDAGSKTRVSLYRWDVALRSGKGALGDGVRGCRFGPKMYSGGIREKAGGKRA